MRRDGHIMAVDLMLWCANNEPAAPAPGKDDFHMETVCTLVNIIGNAARSSVKVRFRYLCRQAFSANCITSKASTCVPSRQWLCRRRRVILAGQAEHGIAS